MYIWPSNDFLFCDLIIVGFSRMVWEQKRWIHYFLLSYGTLPFPPLAVFHQILISKIDCFLIFGTDETICSQSISLIDGNLNSFIVCILFVPSPASTASAIQYKYSIPLFVHIPYSHFISHFNITLLIPRISQKMHQWHFLCKNIVLSWNTHTILGPLIFENISSVFVEESTFRIIFLLYVPS